MDITKRGGTPGLVPLKNAEQTAVDNAAVVPLTKQEPPAEVEASPAPKLVMAPAPAFIPVQMPAPAPRPAPEPAPERPPVPKIETSIAPKPAPIMEEPIVVEAPVPPVPEAKPSPVETYSGDFIDRVKETRASTATILAAEQDAKRDTPAAAPQESKRGRGWVPVAVGCLLLAAGGTGAYIAYSNYRATTAPVPVASVASAPIFVDSREQVSGVGTALQQAVAQAAVESLAPNTVRLLSLEASATTSVFSALNLRAPGVLLRNVNTMGGAAGVVRATSGEQGLFFILPVSSYGITFSSMLSWEPTMLEDFRPLFPPYIEQSAATTTAATTVATTTPVFSIVGFRDEIVANHDVRVYRDAAGRSVLLYGYWDQTTLVIARDPEAFAEILGRLGTARSNP